MNNYKIKREPSGAVPDNIAVDISISFDSFGSVESNEPDESENAENAGIEKIKNVNLVAVYNDYETKSYSMDKTGPGFTFMYSLKTLKGLYFYHFEVEYQDDTREYYYKNGRFTYSDGSMPKWQITVYDRNFKTPDAFKGGIMYHIFIDRFAKSDSWQPKVRDGLYMHPSADATPHYNPINNLDVYGGNLTGIIEKLDYLKKLNVDIIYLSPMFEATSSHKYNTADFGKIDGMFGDEEIFSRLICEAEERGIKIILDVAFNHVGDDSIYFNRYGNFDSLGAYQSKESKYHDWFTFADWDNNRDDYECWWGIDSLPSVKKDQPVFRAFICGVNGIIEKWLRLGLAGYRIDVADELSDRMLRGIHKAVKETSPGSIIIGEVWEDASSKIAYGKRRRYLLGDQLDSVMNYPLKDAMINYLRTGNSRVMREVMKTLTLNYPKQSLDCLMNVIGTHDTMRILTALGTEKFAENSDKDAMAAARLSPGEKTVGIFLLKAAVLMQMTLPGIPCIYYGDEAGMEGYGDPFCRRFFPWDSINSDIFDFYKKICGIREANRDIFAVGKYKLVHEENGLFCYKRSRAGTGRGIPGEPQQIYVCVNLSEKSYDLCGLAAAKSLLTGEPAEELAPQSFDIFM